MRLKLSNFRFICFTFLFFLAFSGCTIKESPSKLATEPTTTQTGTKGQTNSQEKSMCELYETHYFQLAQGNHPDADYMFWVETGPNPFFTNDCLCDVDRYELTFTGLGEDAYVELSDIHFSGLPFHYENGEEGSMKIVFQEPDLLPDANMTVLLTIKNASPVFKDAGGLCIVDNIDGIMGQPGVPQFAPIIYTLPNPPNNGNSSFQQPLDWDRAFIPAAITTGI